MSDYISRLKILIEPRYSIIIPTYNRAKTLALTLDSVCGQTLSPGKYEILVVDDGSIDDTKAVVLNFQKKYPNFSILYFYEQNAGPAKARNLGIKESRGEIIFFTDDDCTVSPNWMETLLDGYKRYPGVVGVGGSYKSFDESLNNRYFHEYINKYRGFVDRSENSHLLGLEKKTNILNRNLAGDTANMSYQREILEEAGGFDENIYFAGAVDLELVRNILWRRHYLLYIPFMVNHLKIFNLTNFFKRSFNQGRGRYYVFLKYQDPPFYDFNFLNFFKKIILYDYNDIKFFPAYFINILAFFIGRCYVKYIKPFKNISSIEEFKKPDTEIFYTEEINVKNNAVLTTKFLKFNRDKILNIDTESNYKFFSVVVPTYNRSRSLINALSHLVGQTISKDSYEIIIVDDGSTDDTESQVIIYMSHVTSPAIRYFKTKNNGPAKARNLGIKESRGEIIFFTDDDCAVPPNWMETLLDGYKRYPGVVGVGGWIWPPDGELEKSAVSRFIYFKCFFLHRGIGSYARSYEVLNNNPLMCFGVFAYNTANICYKKGTLKAMGGFREGFYWPGYEDAELAFRIMQAGHSLLYLPFHVIHSKAMNLLKFVKIYFRRGANVCLFLNIHRESLDKLKPDFVKNYGLTASFVYNFDAPEKFLAFLEWLSLNAGIIYMKNKLTKRDKSATAVDFKD